MPETSQYDINEQTYRLTYNGLKILLNISPLDVNIHNLGDKTAKGSIFLFNHFTRFETFVPQYLLYGHSKAICRSVADHHLFEEKRLGDYLRSVGAVPSNMDNMMDFMVNEINAGRKVVIFPEGAMIKDRKVRDSEGRLAIYKREGTFRRKPHTGAAVIAIKCKMLRDLYRMARDKGDALMMAHYGGQFPEAKTPDELESLALEPVELVPANITFYPMRRDENILEKYVNQFMGVKSKRVLEELKVESNMLLKKTDMDVRFGQPIRVADYLDATYRTIIKSRYSLDRMAATKKGWFKKAASSVMRKRLDALSVVWIKKKSKAIRDDYMNAIYDLTTTNLAHLTAHTLFDLYKKEPEGAFDMLYLRALLFMGISDLRSLTELHLHKDLNKRDYVNSLLIGEEPRLLKILQRFEKAGLLELEGEKSFKLNKKLDQEFPFDSIRVENPAQVLDNEAQSVPMTVESLDRLYKEDAGFLEEKVALLLHRRSLKIYEQDKARFETAAFEGLNKFNQRTTSGTPFFYQTGKAREERVGVLLIHGFSASPAEMEVLGRFLHEKGFDVFGLRLPGHGTSPADLKERSRSEWLSEVKLGMALLQHYCPKFFILGNSMGALLGLIALHTPLFKIEGFLAIAPAFRIKDRRISLVTYLDTAQRIYQIFADLKTEWPYQESRPENPDINYGLLPYHGLFELYQLTKESKEYVEKLELPTLFIQAEHEFTVDPAATYEAFEKIPAKDKTLLKVDEERHVLTLDEKLPVFGAVLDFLERLK